MKSGKAAFDGAPRCNSSEWVFRPVVLRVAATHVLTDELVPFSPESRKVFRYLDWPLCRRKKRHNDRNFPARDLRRLHKPETFLKPHFARRFIALVMDKHMASARNLHARRSKAIKLAPVMPRFRKDMRGRYPKHYWPEDPFTAVATRRTVKRAGQA